MTLARMIDTFADYCAYWDAYRDAPPAMQIDAWASVYMAKYPALLTMQMNDYASQKEDWRQVAGERVFPFLSARLRAMQEAHQHLLASCASLCAQAAAKLEFDAPVICVIYVGIGCGAGWVTTYEDAPAILFGLENIAECHWSDANSIAGLTAHELGHVAQASWRAEAGKPDGKGAWWDIYTEGFAQRCEHLTLGRETWHEAGHADDDWLAWCHAHKAHLAAEFLRYVAEGRDIRPFFGSWFPFEGHYQCGYYLGHEAIKEMQCEGLSMREIGTLDHPEEPLQAILRQYVQECAC
jgi:hypothetical protein